MVRRYWTAINARNADDYLATFTDDAIAYDPIGKPPKSSSDARRRFIEQPFGKLAQLRFQIDFITAFGDPTAVKWTFAACTPDAVLLQMEGIDTYAHAADGRIERLWAFPSAPVTTPAAPAD